MKYFVESNNGYGPAGVIKVCNTREEAEKYAAEYSAAYGVRTKVTIGSYGKRKD